MIRRRAAGDSERLGGPRRRPPSRRSARRSTRGCSTSTRTLTTIAACSRWPASPGGLSAAVLQGAAEVVRRIDLRGHEGIHPRVGAIDVAPIVYLDPVHAGSRVRRGAGARRSARRAARICRCSSTASWRRAVRARSFAAAARRQAGRADRSGRAATGLRSATPAPDRRRRAGRGAPSAGRLQRRAGGAGDGRGCPGHRRARSARAAPKDCEAVRAIGLWLDARGVAQVSTNVEDHRAVPLARVVEAIARHAAPSRAELVGLAPRAAFDGFPGRSARGQPAHGRGRTGGEYSAREWRSARHVMHAPAPGTVAHTSLRLLKSIRRWLRLGASAAPSTAGRPPARSRPAVAPDAHRRPTSARSYPGRRPASAG